MAEKVKIAEIDIGVDKLVAKAGQVKKEINQLKEEQKKLNKETGNLTKANQEQLNQFTRNEVEIKNLNKEYRNSTKVMDAYINIQNQDIRTKDQARDANLKLIAIANQLDTTNEDQAKLLKKVNVEIDANTDFLKENASEYENTKMNIGNYKESIKEALGELGIFGKYQQGVNDVMKGAGPIITFVSTNLKQVKDDFKKAATETYGMSKAQVAAHLTSTALSSGLKILKIALAATGIGLVVLALGSLITYFASTQEGINKVNMVLTPLKEAFNAVKGSVQDLGAAFAKLFSGNISGFLTDIKKIGGEMKNNIKEAVDRGREMETIQQNLNKTEATYISQQAKLRKEFEQQKKLSDDTTKSTEERQKAAEKAIDLQREISSGSIERIKQEGEILRLKQMSNDTSDAEKAELATKLAEIDKALEEEAAKTTEAQNKLNAIVKDGATKAIAARQEITDNAIQKQKEELDLYIASQGIKAKTLQEEVKAAEDISKKKLEILQAEFNAGKVSRTAYETGKLNIANEFAQLQVDAAISNSERELEAFKSSHQSKIESGQFLNEQLFNQEAERLNLVAEQEREFQAKKLEQGIINQQQYNDAIAEVDNQTFLKQEELKLERSDAKKEKQAFELELKRELDAEKFTNQFDLERAREQQRYEAELLAADKLGADLSLIEQKHSNVQEKINRAQEDGKVAMYGDSVGQISKILGDQSAAGKAFALAQALINTYQGITAALALPFPANIAAAATTGATGFAAVKNIIKTKPPKAAQGFAMDINGPSHSQGGSTFYDANGNPLVEAQGGEKMVILKREASKELSVLSALNQKHGGVNLSTPVTYANNGGAVSRQPSGTSIKIPKNIIDYDLLASKMAEANSTLPRPVVDVKDINSQQYNLATVNNRANL